VEAKEKKKEMMMMMMMMMIVTTFQTGRNNIFVLGTALCDVWDN
jgi:hypothetical protein